MLKQATRRKYHYIYKTTCKVTGKYYLGMHSTDNLDDGYIGSGKRLGYSMRKHGKENHVCEILEHYFTREWLREREAELVCAETLTDPMCMNIKLGGEGGWDHITKNEKYSDWVKSGRAATDAMLKERNITKSDLGKLANIQNSKTKTGCVHDPVLKAKYNFANNKEHQQKGNSPEARKKAIKKSRITHDLNGKHKGSGNSQFGKCWIFSLSEKKNLKIDTIELQKYISTGWSCGRKMKF